MSTFRKIISSISIIALLGLGLGIAYIVSQQNLSPDQSDALYGGELEYGYPSAGYLITYTTAGSIKTCGYSVLNNSIAITAAHCVDDAKSMYLGLGQFRLDTTNTMEVDKAIQKQAWVSSDYRPDDFSILHFTDNTNYFRSFAEIAAPTEGCHFRVVAYGRTENPEEASTKPRKSAIVCGSDIDAKTFRIKGSSSGICFGDSGSPVYYDGTNKVVGSVVSIVHEGDNVEDPCNFGNTAIVVRADANESLINDTLEALAPSSGAVEVNDEFSIEVADETILQRLGLGHLEDLPIRERDTYLFYAAIGGIVLMFVILVSTILGGRKKEVHYKQSTLPTQVPPNNSPAIPVQSVPQQAQVATPQPPQIPMTSTPQPQQVATEPTAPLQTKSREGLPQLPGNPNQQ